LFEGGNIPWASRAQNTDRKDATRIMPTRARSVTARSHLTSREIDVLRLLSRGYTYNEIGGKLGISVHTVTSHIKKSYRKLGAHSAAEAVTRAADLHLLDSHSP